MGLGGVEAGGGRGWLWARGGRDEAFVIDVFEGIPMWAEEEEGEMAEEMEVEVGWEVVTKSFFNPSLSSLGPSLPVCPTPPGVFTIIPVERVVLVILEVEVGVGKFVELILQWSVELASFRLFSTAS